MANRILFASSVICGLLHILAMIMFAPPNILLITFLCGSISSIYNHGSTKNLAKWTDRIVMVIGMIIEFFFASNTHVVLILISICLYFSGKRLKSSVPHLVAHFILTTCHIMIVDAN